MSKELPTLYQQFIHVGHYARFRDDLGRRENWEETVDRYISFFKTQTKNNKKIPWEELREAILNLEVMPSMRALMTAGPALEKDNIAGFNPVVGSTKIVTKEYGNIAIKEIEGKTVTVLNKNHDWVKGLINNFGNQPIKKVIFRLNSNTLKEIECTDNHRWVLSNGNVKPTSDLLPGDCIEFINAPKPDIDDDYILGIRHGLIYGDGTATKTIKRVKGYHIRLCGKSKELLWVFDEYPVSYPPSTNGDPVVMLYDGFAATHDLKNLPSSNETDSYLLGFVRGWMAADGSVTKNSQVSLCVSKEGKEWLFKNSEKLGFVIQRTYQQAAETNYGLRKKESHIIYFSRSSCSEEDFLCSWKKECFKALTSYFKVVDVKDESKFSEVYCAEVDETNTFVIEGGLLTGNCSYLPIDNQKAFDEIMYILSCGTGVGFSVETRYTNKLPEVPDELHDTDTTVIFKDSKMGWASGYREFISLLYSGKIAKWDVSQIRPAGARLKTFGGRASGPEPLVDLLKFTVLIFNKAKGRRLTSLECHDIVCKVADVIVSGGVRRSALISLTDLNDDKMRIAKSSNWWLDNNQRALANISAVYEEKPDIGTFMKEWLALHDSHSGERGIFSRKASQLQAAKYERRDKEIDYGTNPCCLPGDIILTVRDYGNISLKELINEIEKTSDGEFEVLAFDGNAPVYTKIITGKMTRKNAELIKLEIEDDLGKVVELRLTPDHMVYTDNRGYIRADEILETDDIILYK